METTIEKIARILMYAVAILLLAAAVRMWFETCKVWEFILMETMFISGAITIIIKAYKEAC